MAGATNGKIQKSRTAEDLKTDSEFDLNEGQPPAKAQSTRSVPVVQAAGARNIMVCMCNSVLMHYKLTVERRLTAKLTRDST